MAEGNSLCFRSIFERNYVPGTSFVNYRLNKYNGDIRFTDFIPSGDGNIINDVMYSEDGNCKQTSNKPKF